MEHCPSESVLRQLGADEMDQAIFTAIESHVEQCGHCQERLEGYVRLSSEAIWEKSAQPDPGELPEVDGFRLIQEIGRGSAGVVYLAKDENVDRLVALKIIEGGWIGGPAGRARWQAESKAVAKVEHDHIVRLLGVGERPKFFFMVFEYISGGTLSDRLSGPLPPRQAVMIFLTLARALAKIHEAGLLHLDLKPSNILVVGQPGADWSELTLKISDFGISRLNALQNTNDSAQFVPCGTPAFMAYEQEEADPGKIGPWTDIYSLGVIFHLLLTGQLPARDDDGNVVSKATRAPGFNGLLDPVLEQICQKCLLREIDQRYSAVDQMVELLQDWLQGDARLLHTQSRPRQWLAGRGRWAGLTAAMVLIGLWVVWNLNGRPLWKRWQGQARVSGATKQARMDHAAWILDLTRDVGSFHGEQLKDLLVASRAETARMIGDGTVQAEQLARDGLLLKNLCIKLNGSLNRKHIEISVDFMDLASILFHESHRRSPADQWILREFVHCETAYSQIHISFESDDESSLVKSVDSITRHLSAAAERLTEITDERTRLFHEIRILDYCKFHAMAFQGAGYPDMAGTIRDLGKIALVRFERDREVPDLAARYAMAEGRFLESSQGRAWLIPEDETRLKWSWVVSQSVEAILQYTAADRDWDAAECRGWTGEMIDQLMDRMRSHRLDPANSPKILRAEIVMPLACVSSTLRKYGGFARAERIEAVLLEIGRELEERFPEDPYSMLLMSEGHLQTWKNQLRRDRPEMALAALRRSLAEARRAAEFVPDLALARDTADDRESRIARFLSGSTNKKP